MPSPRPPVQVVIADDEALIRLGIRAVLERQPDITVLGEASTGLEVIHVTARTHPDVVLMDIVMPELDGIEATRRITATAHPPTILMLTTFDLDEQVYAALKAGAAGFLTKDTPPERLADSVREAAQGETLLAPAITRRLVEAYTQAPAPSGAVPERLAMLTSRELDILTRIARGRSNSEIARELYLSEATIKSDITRIFSKLAVRDRVQATIAAYEMGLVRPGSTD